MTTPVASLFLSSVLPFVTRFVEQWRNPFGPEKYPPMNTQNFFRFPTASPLGEIRIYLVIIDDD